MAIKIKVQRDYLRTEASISLPASVADVHEVLIASKTNGKMVVLYNQGAVQGINIEQNSKLSEAQSGHVRSLLEVEDKVL